jgi:hypothetical protein
MITLRLRLLVVAIGLYFLLMLTYFFGWQLMVNSGFIPQRSSSETLSLGDNQLVNIADNAGMVIYRLGFIPVYWSTIGDLTFFHSYYLLFSSLSLLFFTLHKTIRFASLSGEVTEHKSFKAVSTNSISVKPKLEGGGLFKVKQVILTLWAFIGVAWFALFQLIGFFSEDISIAIITMFSVLMWLAFFASVGFILLPRLKLIYNKLWSGGEKHDK